MLWAHKHCCQCIVSFEKIFFHFKRSASCNFYHGLWACKTIMMKSKLMFIHNRIASKENKKTNKIEKKFLFCINVVIQFPFSLVFLFDFCFLCIRDRLLCFTFTEHTLFLSLQYAMCIFLSSVFLLRRITLLSMSIV